MWCDHRLDYCSHFGSIGSCWLRHATSTLVHSRDHASAIRGNSSYHTPEQASLKIASSSFHLSMGGKLCCLSGGENDVAEASPSVVQEHCHALASFAECVDGDPKVLIMASGPGGAAGGQQLALHVEESSEEQRAEERDRRLDVRRAVAPHAAGTGHDADGGGAHRARTDHSPSLLPRPHRLAALEPPAHSGAQVIWNMRIKFLSGASSTVQTVHQHVRVRTAQPQT